MPSLNIVGAGNLGKTLGRLWQQSGFFQVTSVCNRSLANAEQACQFIGAGEPTADLLAMAEADCWLIATPDREIASVAHALAERLDITGAGEQATIVFHCSGALSSESLAACKPSALASAHPVHSFANPAQSVATLAGSSVAIEGSDSAVDLLRRAFAAIGCKPLALAMENKSLYHAGSVFACNYLTVLMDLSLRTFAAAGIERQQALELLRPIVLQTAENNMQLGPENALTGPIARGDSGTVQTQLQALQQSDTQLAQHYRHLGRACVELAQRGGLPEAEAARILDILLDEQEEPSR